MCNAFWRMCYSNKSKYKGSSKLYEIAQTAASKEMTQRQLGKKLPENWVKSITQAVKGAGNPRARKIICLGTLEIFPYIGVACKKYNISLSSLSACLRGKSKTAGGYYWEYYNERKAYERKTLNGTPKHTVNVICVEKNLIFSSIKGAAEAFGTKPSNITDCLRRPNRKFKGFHWKYV